MHLFYNWKWLSLIELSINNTTTLLQTVEKIPPKQYNPFLHYLLHFGIFGQKENAIFVTISVSTFMCHKSACTGQIGWNKVSNSKFKPSLCNCVKNGTMKCTAHVCGARNCGARTGHTFVGKPIVYMPKFQLCLCPATSEKQLLQQPQERVLAPLAPSSKIKGFLSSHGQRWPKS